MTESDKIKWLYKHVSAHNSSEILNYDFSLDGKLRPTLRSYQTRAVKWMLKRENAPEVTEVNGENVDLPLGGILADEMGLGKTIEMLACILSNPCPEYSEGELKKISRKRRSDVFSFDDPDDDYQPTSKKRKRNKSTLQSEKKPYGLKSEKYSALRRSYELQLAQMSLANVNRHSGSACSDMKDVMCFCNKNDSDSLYIVQCESCRVWQHAECLGIENGFTFGTLKCPQCWSKSDLLPAKATLIITPASISNQWVQEIEKHVNSPDFKYLVYTGVRDRTYIQPPTLAGYDVIITTYNVLCSEMNYLQSESRRPLRHAQKYYSPTSPLTCLKWWRVCLDEAQMVEGCTSKTALMAAELTAIHRWAVTGTPIQKCVSDLYGLILFLHLEPLTDFKKWNALELQTRDFFNFISKILWRTSKAQVNEELGVPPQTVKTHFLDFSPVEAYFYRTMHTDSAAAFQQKLSRFDDLSVKLCEINRKQLNSILLPLLGIRQACTHPQVVRGKFLRYKHTMTMEELMTQMVTKAKIDADVAMRSLVAALHGIAALHIIEYNWTAAAESYRKVLQLSSEYEPNIKVDTLQMIHCLHNLAEVLEDHGDGIPPTLRDSELRNQAQSLAEGYLQKYYLKLQSTKESLLRMNDNVLKQCKGFTLGFTGWWKHLINRDIDDEDLLKRIHTCLEDNEVPGQPKLSQKLTGMHIVERELAVWLANIDTLREETQKAITSIEDFYTFVDSAMACHVNTVKKKKSKVKKCKICIAEGVMKKYEALIFSVNEKNLVEQESIKEEEEESEEKGKGKGQEIKFFKTNKESSWKPSPHELVLQVLAVYSKRVDQRFADEASEHLALLECVRKEFKSIRAFWRTVSDTIYAMDELYMARLRLRLPDSEESGKPFQRKLASFIVPPHEVPWEMYKFKLDQTEAEASLKKTSGTLLYLKNLQDRGTTDQDCPICKDTLTNKWSVLACGHCCCFDCIRTLFKITGRVVDCPLCRVAVSKDSISYVVSRDSVPEDPHLRVKGSHSTKVCAVILELLKLLKEDPKVKVIMVSTWDKVLEIIKDALIQNDINYRRIEGASGTALKNNLSQFKNGSPNVLLLPLKHGSKGLNLTEATHMFLVEPILNPADELQAVGRIHRIGQTKPTFVHRFVVRNTIEERMQSSLVTCEQDWQKENLTLEKLNNLFILQDDENNQEASSE